MSVTQACTFLTSRLRQFVCCTYVIYLFENCLPQLRLRGPAALSAPSTRFNCKYINHPWYPPVEPFPSFAPSNSFGHSILFLFMLRLRLFLPQFLVKTGFSHLLPLKSSINRLYSGKTRSSRFNTVTLWTEGHNIATQSVYFEFFYACTIET